MRPLAQQLLSLKTSPLGGNRQLCFKSESFRRRTVPEAIRLLKGKPLALKGTLCLRFMAVFAIIYGILHILTCLCHLTSASVLYDTLFVYGGFLTSADVLNVVLRQILLL